ncbi:MAG: hypothetical protein HDT26_02645 [Subdoligranulum sp.]|nr:hypothetical protein [Subdoligranulum sp.]
MKKLFAMMMALMMVICLAGCGVSIASISLPDSLDLDVGESAEAAVTFTADQEGASPEKLAEAAGKLELVWTSSDESIATVDSGVVTAVGGGTAVITVSTADGALSACVNVNVTIPLEDIEADDITMTTLDKGMDIAYALVPEDAMNDGVDLTVADESVVTAKDGKLSAAAAGKTELTLSSGDISRTVEVTVLQAPAELTVEDVSVRVGNEAALVIELGLDEDMTAAVGTDFTYGSADEQIATVNEEGIVTGISAGETEVTVTNELGQSCTAAVEVTEAPANPRPGQTAGASGGQTGAGTAGGEGGGPPAPATDTTPAYGAIPFEVAAQTGKWWAIDASDSAYWAVQENINAIRAAGGLPALSVDDGLSAIASDRCRSFVEGGPFDHSGMVTKSEICASGALGSASAVCSAWQNSPGHYANIMLTDITSMGIGCWFCSIDGNNYTYWVVTFQ